MCVPQGKCASLRAGPNQRLMKATARFDGVRSGELRAHQRRRDENATTLGWDLGHFGRWRMSLRRSARMLLLIGILGLWPESGRSQVLEVQLKPLVDEISAGAERAGAKRLTVADFTDLQGQVTELGRFVAEELATSLVLARPRFGVVDRANLRSILAEHKLSMSGLVNPENAKKLGLIAGVDGIVVGTITPLGESVRITMKVIATDTATVMAAARSDVARTKAIDELLGKGVESGRDGRVKDSEARGTSSGTPVDPRNVAHVFENRWVRMTVRSFTISETGEPRLSLRLDSLAGEDGRLRCYPFQLIDDTGAVWQHMRAEGLDVSNFMPGTLLSPNVPGLASVGFRYWQGTPPEARSFDLTGQCQMEVRGRANVFPLTISGLVPSK